MAEASLSYAAGTTSSARRWSSRSTTTGSGASFYVELPVSGTPMQRPSAPQQADFASLAGSTVLVVEDEPALAAAVSEALPDAGFIVDRAGDGEEALRRVAGKS